MLGAGATDGDSAKALILIKVYIEPYAFIPLPSPILISVVALNHKHLITHFQRSENGCYLALDMHAIFGFICCRPAWINAREGNA